MKVLVTGGAGYVGSHASKALAAAGHIPITFDNLSSGHRSAVKWGPFLYGDIRDQAALGAAFLEHRPDAVMHFAAKAYVGESVERPDIYYSTNVTGSLSLLEAMRVASVSNIVFSSTCATYGDQHSDLISEQTPQRPINPYGRSKLMVEQIIGDYCDSFHFTASLLRYFNAAGADTEGEIGELHDPEPHLIPRILQVALGNRSHVSILGNDYATVDGTCVRDYVHVSDLARAHVLALANRNSRPLSIYNLGAGAGTSVLEVIQTAEHVTQRPIATEIGARRPGDPAILVADPALARAELGWTPSMSSMEHIISTAWSWMLHRSANDHSTGSSELSGE